MGASSRSGCLTWGLHCPLHQAWEAELDWALSCKPGLPDSCLPPKWDAQNDSHELLPSSSGELDAACRMPPEKQCPPLQAPLK